MKNKNTSQDFMKALSRLLHLLVIVLVCGGCNLPQTQDGLRIPVSLSKEDHVSIFDYVNKVELVQLENLPEAMVADETVKDMVVIRDGFLLLDRRTFLIRMFGPDGKYIKTIDKVGRGHGEFPRAEALQVDEDGTLLVLSATGGINRYDLREGNAFIEHIPVEGGPVAIHHFMPLGGQEFLLFSASDPARVYFYDAEKAEAKAYFQEIPRWFSLSYYYDFQESPFYKRDGKAFFYTGCDGAVFQFDAETKEWRSALSWVIGDNSFDAHDVSQAEASVTNPAWKEIFDQKSNQAVLRLSRVNESSRFVLASGVYRQEPVSLIYNKRNHSCVLFHKVKEEVLFRPRFTRDEIGYTLLSPENLSLYVNRAMLRDEHSRQIFDSANEDSNSILVKYYWKK